MKVLRRIVPLLLFSSISIQPTFGGEIEDDIANESYPISIASENFTSQLLSTIDDAQVHFYLESKKISREALNQLLEKPLSSSSITFIRDGHKNNLENTRVVLTRTELNLDSLTELFSDIDSQYELSISFIVDDKILLVKINDEIRSLPKTFALTLDNNWNSLFTPTSISHGEDRISPARFMMLVKKKERIHVEEIRIHLDQQEAKIYETEANIDVSGVRIKGLNHLLSQAKSSWSVCLNTDFEGQTLALCGQSALIPDTYLIKINPEYTNDKPAKIKRIAQILSEKYQGKIRHIFEHAYGGFSGNFDRKVIDSIKRDNMVQEIVKNQEAFVQTIQNSPPSWGIDRIDERALVLDDKFEYHSTGNGVNIYIIDSGIRATHNEFSGRLGTGANFVGLGTGTDDCNGHGTHVAGTAAGTNVGVAKQATIIPVRVMNCAGTGSTEDIIGGIDWVTANAIAPAVVNISIGYNSPTINTAVDSAIEDSIASGTSYVIAAGNQNDDACDYSYSRVDEAITVGATKRKRNIFFSVVGDKRWSNSNKGSCVDIFAPGKRIRSAWINNDNDRKVLKGTSMAAPHVAGIAALYLEDNPTATPANVFSMITSNATSGVITNVGSGSPNSLAYWNRTPCNELVTLHNGSTITPTFDGSNCYVMPVPAGKTGFVYDNKYYVTPSYTDCGLGSYDGANCYFMTKPASGFIYDNNFYTAYDDCDTGVNDSANCYIASAPAGTSPFVYAGNFYTTPLPGNNCPIGYFDGANCYLMAKPAGGFIYANNFYTTYDGCSIGTNDSANCYIASAPLGTTAFIYSNNFYTTPLPTPSCVAGVYDSANCFIGSAPAVTDPFVYMTGFYYDQD